MRILVTGDVNFDNKTLLFKKMDKLTLQLAKVEIAITGQCSYLGKSLVRTGVEYHATNWCGKWKWPYLVYHTDRRVFNDKQWSPEERLKQMFWDCQAAVFFWDGKDKTTKELIRKCRKANLDVRVYYYAD